MPACKAIPKEVQKKYRAESFKMNIFAGLQTSPLQACSAEIGRKGNAKGKCKKMLPSRSCKMNIFQWFAKITFTELLRRCLPARLCQRKCKKKYRAESFKMNIFAGLQKSPLQACSAEIGRKGNAKGKCKKMLPSRELQDEHF